MQKVFRIIKGRRNLRRLSVVWLLLVVMKLFCPLDCDDLSDAVDLKVPKVEITSLIDSKEKPTLDYISDRDQQNTDHDQTGCNNDCLCHAAAIASVNIITFKVSVKVNERIVAFSYNNPAFNALSMATQELTSSQLH